MGKISVKTQNGKGSKFIFEIMAQVEIEKKVQMQVRKMNSHMSKIIERTDDEIFNSINETKR